MLRESVNLISPAKINLSLDVISRRSDGYHNLDTVMQAITLFDYISITKLKDNNQIKLICNNPDVPIDQNNLVYKAVKHFFSYTEIKMSGLLIDITKNIPLMSGLAGGSSNAAAALIGLDQLFCTRLSTLELINLSRIIGADVPFFIKGGTFRATGIGEKLAYISNNKEYYIVIVKPEFGVDTKEAYDRIDQLLEKPYFDMETFIYKLKYYNDFSVFSNMYNIFENVVQSSQIQFIKNKLIKFGAVGSLMTGSGSAVFGIFEDKSKVNLCYNYLININWNVYMCNSYPYGVSIS